VKIKRKITGKITTSIAIYGSMFKVLFNARHVNVDTACSACGRLGRSEALAIICCKLAAFSLMRHSPPS
jgi:hypothetical protein